MKKHLVLGLLLLLAIPLLAQDESKGQAYIFVAPGVSVINGQDNGFLHFGGGDVFVYKGLAAGAEIGYVTPYSNFGDGFGLFSANGAYHFKSPERKVVPFVTGGYSMAFRSGNLNGFNYGGGATWWTGNKVGVRFEFRDNYFPQDPGWHQLGFRVGLSFR